MGSYRYLNWYLRCYGVESNNPYPSPLFVNFISMLWCINCTHSFSDSLSTSPRQTRKQALYLLFLEEFTVHGLLLDTLPPEGDRQEDHTLLALTGNHNTISAGLKHSTCIIIVFNELQYIMFLSHPTPQKLISCNTTRMMYTCSNFDNEQQPCLNLPLFSCVCCN